MVGTPEWMQRRMGLWRHRGHRPARGSGMLKAGYVEAPLGRDALRAIRKGLRDIRFGRVPRLGAILEELDILQAPAERSAES